MLHGIFPMSEPDSSTPAGHSPLAWVERFLMAASMGMLCLLTMANVLVRYFTDFSFAFTEEISVSLLVIMTLVGASHAFATAPSAGASTASVPSAFQT